MRLLLGIILCGLAVCSYAMKDHYQAGKQHGQDGVALGNPNQWDDGFLARNKEVGHLSNMNDTTLSDQGGDAYRAHSTAAEATDRARSAQTVSDHMAQSGSKAQSQHGALQTEAGNLLTISEVRKIDAINEHKIDPNDQFYKDSLAIESNPLSKTGSVEVKRKITVTQETMESCEEGVKFQVDVVNQLTYVPPPLVTYQAPMKFTGSLIKYGQYSYGLKLPESATITGISVKFWHEGHNSFFCHATYKGYINGKHFSSYRKSDCWHLYYFLPFSAQNLNVAAQVGSPVSITFNGGGLDEWLNRFPYTVNATVTRKKRSNEPAKEYWHVVTKDSEALIEQHSCHEIKRQCLDAGEKHFDELMVTRPCWKWQVTYACESQPINGCKYLQDQGCYLKTSTCIDASIKPCAKWKRQYQCMTKTEVETTGIDNTEVFCLDGNCHTPEIEKNTDMNQAIAQLAVFKEMQKQMSHDNPPSVFKGEVAQCSRHMVNFTDCCTSMSGWGTSVGLSKCSAEEKALAGRKEKRLCHYVGTYCAEKMKLTGICLRKKSSYCCFPDKLARLLHEQGRPQLSRGWGSAEHPDCGALSAHELQRIKLDQMDFSEIFQDLFKDIGAKALKAVPRQMQNQMPVAQKNIEVMRQQNNGPSNVQKQVF